MLTPINLQRLWGIVSISLGLLLGMVYVIVWDETSVYAIAPWYCSFNGMTITNGSSITGYRYTFVPYGLAYSCETLWDSYEIFQCNDGTLSGLNGWLSYQFPARACTNGSPLSCTLGSTFWQQITIPHYTLGGSSGEKPPLNMLNTYLFIGYKQNQTTLSSSWCNTPDYDNNSNTNSTYTYCRNGTLHNASPEWSTCNIDCPPIDTTIYRHTQCSTFDSRNCRLGNTMIPHGENITAYDRGDTRESLGLCQSEIRTCSDGTLSWSYTYLSCASYNGSCGLANWYSFNEIPTENLCAAGIPGPMSYSSSTKKWSRQCRGDLVYEVWTNADCYAYWTGTLGNGICNEFPYGAVGINSTNNGLCLLGVVTNFVYTSNWREWLCRTADGYSPTCETKKAIFPTADIVYATSSNGLVTATLSNIQPYNAFVKNNNGNNSKLFRTNGTFIFMLEYNGQVNYLTASVSSINRRSLLLKDIVSDQYNFKCIQYRNTRLKQSSLYNTLDFQTMLNNCLITFPKSLTTTTIQSLAKKKLTREEFIINMYQLISKIRPYTDAPTQRSDIYTYTSLTSDKNKKNNIWRFSTVSNRETINHTTNSKNNKRLTISRKSPITPTEVHNTLIYLLESHQDNSVHRQKLREETYRKNRSSITYAEYAKLIRKLLESYERIAIGNNDQILYQSYQKVKNRTVDKQKEYLKTLSKQLSQINSSTAEKKWISPRRLLDDFKSIYNNTIPTRKAIISLSIKDITTSHDKYSSDPNDLIDTEIIDKTDLFIKLPY